MIITKQYIYIQDLEKEADYIYTDVDYMALQDSSEFSQSLTAIENMKSELDMFNSRLVELNDKLLTSSTVFSNVTKVS